MDPCFLEEAEKIIASAVKNKFGAVQKMTEYTPAFGDFL